MSAISALAGRHTSVAKTAAQQHVATTHASKTRTVAAKATPASAKSEEATESQSERLAEALS